MNNQTGLHRRLSLLEPYIWSSTKGCQWKAHGRWPAEPSEVEIQASHCSFPPHKPLRCGLLHRVQDAQAALSRTKIRYPIPKGNLILSPLRNASQMEHGLMSSVGDLNATVQLGLEK